MSDALPISENKLWTTPLRDLLRGRITGRLNWKGRLTAANLPAAVSQIIERIVKRTRLWRMEKTAVVDELTAHFQDGLAAGSTAEELIERFGSDLAAAKLIRRAKRRNRPLVWHACIFCMRAAAVFLVIYSVFLVRFWVGKPTIATNYLAKMNESIRAVSEPDRAWPLWRKAMLTLPAPFSDEGRKFTDFTGSGDEKTPWPAKAAWIDQHQDFVEIARQAGLKPKLGFVLGPAGSQNDPQLYPTFSHEQGPDPDMLLLNVLLPQLNDLAEAGEVLLLDTRRAEELHDGPRVQADLVAMLGLGRQLLGNDGFIVTEMTGVGRQNRALTALQHVIENDPSLLTDRQLISFSHQISGPEVAADLISLEGERFLFQDIVQHCYTDDGNGSGRITPDGVKMISMLGHYAGGVQWYGPGLISLEQAMPLAAAPRAELMSKYNRWMDEMEAKFRRPIRQTDWTGLKSEWKGLGTPGETSRYAILAEMFPDVSHSQVACERYLGKRDGTVVAIALEIYHRRHGAYPATLAELRPQMLPAIPADRITGEPVKYKLINGKPVVYSVGADHVDDGGTRPNRAQPGPRRNDAASWNGKPAEAVRGDWILYPPEDEQ